MPTSISQCQTVSISSEELNKPPRLALKVPTRQMLQLDKVTASAPIPVSAPDRYCRLLPATLSATIDY